MKEGIPLQPRAKQENLSTSEEYLLPIASFVSRAVPEKMRAALTHLFENSLSKPTQFLMQKWFAKHEALIAGKEAALETIIHHSPENQEAQAEAAARVLMIAGQFNESFLEHAARFTAAPVSEGRQRHITAFERLYSSRDIATVETYMNEIEQAARAELEVHQDKPVILLGFSFGGIVGKIIADKLSAAYPGRIGLVTWHSPLDPEVGLMVRAARFEEIYKALGYEATHSGQYPVVVLTGDADGIVPVCSSLNLQESVALAASDEAQAEHTHTMARLMKVKPKANPGATHADPLNSDLAVRRLSASVELARQAASRFPEKPDERAFEHMEEALQEAGEPLSGAEEIVLEKAFEDEFAAA